MYPPCVAAHLSGIDIFLKGLGAGSYSSFCLFVYLPKSAWLRSCNEVCHDNYTTPSLDAEARLAEHFTGSIESEDSFGLP
jgi:hypothetical protein